MRFFKLSRNFAKKEDGAVTVDWVVLTSALVGLGIAIMTTVGSATSELGGKISTKLVQITITVN